MAHRHSIAPGAAPRASLLARGLLLGALGVVAIATIVGLVLLWPDGAKVETVRSGTQFVVEGATFESGVVEEISEGCAGQENLPPEATSSILTACRTALVRVTTGDAAGSSVEVVLRGQYASAGVVAGDGVQLLRLPDGTLSFGAPAPEDTEPGGTIDGPAPASASMTFFGVDRSGPLLGLLIVFVVIVGLVAWLRGLLALVGLVFSGAVILGFMLPAIVGGSPGAPVALVTASTILFVVLYLAHGPSIRTSTALAGTLCGIAITALIAQLAVPMVRLSGITDEAAGVLSGVGGDLDFRGVLTCAMIIAGLGVLNDVTITQSSSVWELRAAGPGLSRLRLFWSGMRIGRDHIASTIYTIVFAYVGTSLSVLLLLYLYDLPVLELLTFEDLAAEIVTTLCSAIGLVLAVPITTAIAVLLVGPAAPSPASAPVAADPSPVVSGSVERPASPQDDLPPAEPRNAGLGPTARDSQVWRPLDWDF